MVVDQGLIPIMTTKFSNRLDLKLQQMGSKLRGRVDEMGGLVGKQVSPVQQLGAVQSKAPAGRFAPKDRTPQDFTRRWVFPTDREIEQYEDNFDLLRTTVDDPKSKFVESAAMAAGRDWDDAILAAATATAKIGVDQSAFTDETFDTTKFQIAANFGASAATGLTVTKMIETRRILRKYHNDLETDPATLVITSTQEADLLKQVQVTNKEYNASVAANSVLVDGRVSRFVGFDIVVMERVPETTANTTKGCIAFVKSGLVLGMWQDLKTQIFQDFTLSGNPWNVSTVHTYGVTRTQPGKVIQVLCADTSGADITP